MANSTDHVAITQRGNGGTLIEMRWRVGVRSGRKGAEPALTIESPRG